MKTTGFLNSKITTLLLIVLTNHITYKDCARYTHIFNSTVFIKKTLVMAFTFEVMV